MESMTWCHRTGGGFSDSLRAVSMLSEIKHESLGVTVQVVSHQLGSITVSNRAAHVQSDWTLATKRQRKRCIYGEAYLREEYAAGAAFYICGE